MYHCLKLFKHQYSNSPTCSTFHKILSTTVGINIRMDFRYRKVSAKCFCQRIRRIFYVAKDLLYGKRFTDQVNIIYSCHQLD